MWHLLLILYKYFCSDLYRCARNSRWGDLLPISKPPVDSGLPLESEEAAGWVNQRKQWIESFKGCRDIHRIHTGQGERMDSDKNGWTISGLRLTESLPDDEKETFVGASPCGISILNAAGMNLNSGTFLNQSICKINSWIWCIIIWAHSVQTSAVSYSTMTGGGVSMSSLHQGFSIILRDWSWVTIGRLKTQ